MIAYDYYDSGELYSESNTQQVVNLVVIVWNFSDVLTSSISTLCENFHLFK